MYPVQNEQLQVITTDIRSCKQKILDILKNDKIKAEDLSRAQSFIHVLRIFETEMLCHLKDWNSLKQTITVRVLLHRCQTILLSHSGCIIRTQFGLMPRP